jgi:hypothetical protein
MPLVLDGTTGFSGGGGVATSTALGSSALFTNSTGTNLVAIGYQAGYFTTAGPNVFVGSQAGYTNSTGTSNIGIGYQALYSNTTASNNTAVGYQAGYSNTTGTQNSFFGEGSGYATTGNYNAFFGTEINYNGGAGSSNSGLGHQALRYATGSNNTAVGYQSLNANTTGPSNTAVGYQALYGNTTGGYNVCVGRGAGNNASYTADYNSFIGYGSGRNTTTGSANLAIGIDSGTDAVFNITTASYRAVIGDNSITNAYVKVAWTVTSDARDKTNIVPIGHGLDFVQQLNPVSYNFKKSREDDTVHGGKRYGFLAQEILALEGQDNVIIDNEDEQNLKYQGEALVPVLVKAIKELKTLVDAQAAEIVALKAKVGL